MGSQSFRRYLRTRSNLTRSFSISINHQLMIRVSSPMIRSLIRKRSYPLIRRLLNLRRRNLWLRNHKKVLLKKTRLESLIMKNSINEVSTHLSL
jgi:hypothetical protein